MSRKPKEEVAVVDAMETHSFLKQQLKPTLKKTLTPKRRVDFRNLGREADIAFTGAAPFMTGFASLDEQLGGGFYPGVVAIVGEPGSGKTTLIKQFAENIVPGLVFPADFDYVMLSRARAEFGSFDVGPDAQSVSRFLTERKTIAAEENSVFIFSSTIRSALFGAEANLIERIDQSAYRVCDTMLHMSRIIDGDDIYFSLAANIKNRYGRFDYPLTFIMENGKLELA